MHLRAGPGTVVALRDLLLGQRMGADVAASGGPAKIWRIPEKSFRAIARQHPDLSLLLFQAAFGATGALTRALQVSYHLRNYDKSELVQGRVICRVPHS